MSFAFACSPSMGTQAPPPCRKYPPRAGSHSPSCDQLAVHRLIQIARRQAFWAIRCSVNTHTVCFNQILPMIETQAALLENWFKRQTVSCSKFKAYPSLPRVAVALTPQKMVTDDFKGVLLASSATRVILGPQASP